MICLCVARHTPAAYVPNRHHILPKSWGGLTTTANLITICPNAHSAVHRLLDAYVKAGGLPDTTTRRGYSPFVRDLAARAWAQRPPNPTITSITGA